MNNKETLEIKEYPTERETLDLSEIKRPLVKKKKKENDEKSNN
jgi:hypothetical protein